jgi:tetratricopeptide (TPR) repeat protein
VTGDLLHQRTPYPGLRAFRREETDLFFGREDCINAMVDRLAATRFLAVLGSSGTGKSSLVRTGLLDALELGLMAKAGSRWKIVDFRPGGSPLKNLARRLLETEGAEENPSVAAQDVDLLRAFLARGPRAVVEWCHSGHLPQGGNLLLLVDQFEELFRYQDYAGREEAEAFVALLIESAREADVPIYVAITMRSEYLGACALIEGLSDAINAGMFLTPRMTREHCREAIVGPAEVCNIDIEPALVNRLLNDLTNFAPWDKNDTGDQLDRLMRRADQLPLLQYTLNRMWQRAHDRSPGARVKLTVDDYVAIEGLSGALNAHANQIFQDLGKENAQVAEWVFRALTAGSTIADAVRRPTRLDDLIATCGGNEAAVRAVVDAFRAPGVNFLLPEFNPHNPKLALDTYIDISHESLIRQWNKLSEWLGLEGRAAQQWRRLVDRFGTGEVLRGRELANLTAWRTETKPNAAWARRYGGDFPAVIAFLDKSQRAQNRKRVTAIAITVGAFALVTGFGVYIAKQAADLSVQLAQTESERQRADTNESQIVILLESMIFDISQPLTTSDGSTSHIASARRAPVQSDREGSRLAGTDDDHTDDQPTGDRETSQVPETRNREVTAASTSVQNLRRLTKSNPKNARIRRLYAVTLNWLGDAHLRVNDPKNAPANAAAAERAFNESLKLIRAEFNAEPHTIETNATTILWKDEFVLATAGVARVKMRRNDHAGARPDLEQAIAVARSLADFMNYQDVRILRVLQTHLGYLGDTYISLRMRPQARTAFEERLDVRRKLAEMRPGDPQLMSDLSIALDRVGQLVRDDVAPNDSRKYFQEALQIDRALFKRDPDRRQWRENLVFSLTRIGDLERQLGRQRDALGPYEEALALQRKNAADVNAVGPQQTLASLLQKIGDAKRRLRDYTAAIRAHREELTIRRRLLTRDPGNLQARRNVSSALDYLGNSLRESKDLAGARTAFTEQLEIDRTLAKIDPDNVSSLTDLAWSLNRLGDLDRDASKPNEAARYYEEALGIQRKLIARDTDSLVRMRALALAASKLGLVRSRMNDYTTALSLHQEELGLRRKLYERTPDDTDALRNLSLALDRVGNVYRDLNETQNALRHFEEELSMDRRFVTRAPQNVTALQDLQWTLNKIGDFVRQRLGDRAAARKYIEEMIGINRRLVELQPTSKDRHRRLKDDLTKLANLLLDMNQAADARETYAETFIVVERWLGVARENFMATSSDSNRNDLLQAYGDAGWHAILAGRAEAALPHIESALSINPDTPWNTVNLAHTYLFLGRYDEAIKLYSSVRNRNRTEDGKRTYANEIKDDFGIFRRLGLTRPDMARAEKELRL